MNHSTQFYIVRKNYLIYFCSWCIDIDTYLKVFIYEKKDKRAKGNNIWLARNFYHTVENTCNNWRSEIVLSGLMCLRTIKILSLWVMFGRNKQTKMREQNTFEAFWASERAHVHSSAVPELPGMWNSLSKRSNVIYLAEISTPHWVLLDSRTSLGYAVLSQTCLQVQSQARCPHIILHTKVSSGVESKHLTSLLFLNVWYPSFPTAPGLTELNKDLGNILSHMAWFFLGVLCRVWFWWSFWSLPIQDIFVILWCSERSVSHKICNSYFTPNEWVMLSILVGFQVYF